MTKAQEILKMDIEKIQDEAIIEKIWIFILGILTQQNISEQPYTQKEGAKIKCFFEMK